MPIQTEMREITPAEAISILERNPTNRTVRQIRVQQLARDMKAGRWRRLGANPEGFPSLITRDEAIDVKEEYADDLS